MIWRAFFIGAAVGVCNGIILWIHERLQVPQYRHDNQPVH